MAIALVTGAHGFIGRHLARHLRTTGISVVGLGHGAWPDHKQWGLSDWLNGEVEASNLDILASRHGSFTQVYHLAGGSTVGASLQSPLEDFSRTALTTARLLEWVRIQAPEARMMGASSAAVYGAGHSGFLREDALPNPLAPYGTHKLILEELFRSYARNFGIQSVIVRMFSVYGPELRKQLLWDLCAKLENKGSAILGGTGEERRDWLHVSDAARLLTSACERADDSCPMINGGTGLSLTVAEVAEFICTAWGGDVDVSFSGEVRAGDPDSLVADMSAARSLTGFDPEVAVERGFESYVRWYRGHRELG